MVQRKVPSKLGIQDENDKSEKRLGNLKPTSCHHQDGKNSKGLDMRKKMKRSGSIKHSDIESLKSSPLRKIVSQPQKFPPFDAQTTATSAAATPQSQKQSMIKSNGGSPNYMKGTSCSEARKEHSQVSTPSGSDNKNLRRRSSSNSKLGSDNSSNKPAKTSSLELVRTLTKSPSFKPVRNTAKKCSRVALCADIDVHKATCSSTLKDSKFPKYLMLNPGGSEAEGTSVLKVCPYNYCSLNGHHHTPPLPPLKCFLKARRRSLKAQKSANLDVSSPRRAKRSGDGTEKISTELNFSDDKPLQEEADSIETAEVSFVKEADLDFFIEIYAKDMVDDPEAMEKHTKAAAEVSDNLSDASSQSGIDFEENYDYSQSVDMWITGDFREKQKAGDADYVPVCDEEAMKANCFDESFIEVESQGSIEEDHNISDASDMEWEEGQFSTLEIHTEHRYLDKSEKEPCINYQYFSDIKKVDLCDEPEINQSDEKLSNCMEEILVHDLLHDLFEEETASFGTQSDDGEFGTEDMLQTWETLEATEVDCDSTCDQMEEPTVEPEASNENVLINPAAEDEPLQDKESMKLLQSPIADSSQILESSDANTSESQKPEKTEVTAETSTLNEIAEESTTTQQLVDEKSSANNGEDGQCQSINIAENQNQLEKGHERAGKSQIPASTDAEQKDLRMCEVDSIEGKAKDEEVCNKVDNEEPFIEASDGISAGSKRKHTHKGNNSTQELDNTCGNRKWTIKCRKHIMDSEEEREFNPREPNFLPVVPDPESEKVDLRHQMMDDRKNAEEWMLDYALQQAVTKLAPARKRKVALLVEAFEKVLPVPKYESHTGHAPAALSQTTRSLQACS